MGLSGRASTDNERPREPDIAKIRRFLETAGEALNKGDPEGEVNRFTEDSVYMWLHAQSIEGHATLREWFVWHLAQVERTLKTKRANSRYAEIGHLTRDPRCQNTFEER